MKFRLTHLAVALLAASVARAEDWTITTADFAAHPASLVSLSPAGVGIVASDSTTQPAILPLDQFVSAIKPAQSSSPANFTLLLVGGDRLTGTPAGVTDEKISWNNPSLETLTIPLSRLVSLSRGDAAAAADQPPKQDIVKLANGDVVSGVVTDCTADTITITTDNGPAGVPLASVSSATFAATAGGEAVGGHGFRIRLADGSVVTAADVSVSQNHLTMTLNGKPLRTISLDLSRIAGIEQIDGPVRWLSSLTPVENVQIPYFGSSSSAWPARFDMSVDHTPIQFDGHRFDHGIGVHAYSRLTFAIDPGWLGFRTQYAIDQPSDEPRPLADVTVRIRVDDKVVYEQTHVRAGALSGIVALELSGAKKLALEADYGDSGDIQAHLDWIEPALLRKP